MPRPVLSIVFAARNDNYGGLLVERIEAMLRVLEYLAQQSGRLIEVVMVEYNPPPKARKLSMIFRRKKQRLFTLRCIEVPPEFHQRFKDNRIPLLEYVAKNIGIRRAKADYILATNQDILFSQELFEFLTSNQLQQTVFYRANRSDVPFRSFDTSTAVPEILQLCRDHAYQIFLTDRVAPLRPFSLFSFTFQFAQLRAAVGNLITGEKPARSLQYFHELAAGDFLLMHASMWKKIRGYDETPLSNFIDGYILYVAHCFGYTQQILTQPLYHMDHDVAKAGRKSVSFAEYVVNCQRMLATKKPYHRNGRDWGFSTEEFPERVLS